VVRAMSGSTMMRHGWICGLFLVACGGSSAPVSDDGPGLLVNVSALSLSGIDDVCYALTVYASADRSGPVVWQKAHVCSSQFGDSHGSLSYVATCDANAGTNTVQLVVEDLCSGGPCDTSGTSLAATSWVNPCKAPSGCVASAVCAPNADTPVSFSLTIARSANQGFFDVAVTFDDIFCSAKLDCQDTTGAPLTLLFDPDGNQRGPTVVVAWACTAGPGTDTWLYLDNVVISCFDGLDHPIGSWPYDPSLGPGNAGPGAAPFMFQTGVYRTTEANGIASWNLAFGLHPDELPGRCVLSAQATASNGALVDDATPAGGVYPLIQWNVTLSQAAGALSCTKHPLNGTNSGVTTGYSDGRPVLFSHAMHGSDQQVSSRQRKACGGVITPLASDVSFVLAPEGLTARVAGEQSPFYRMPEGYTLQGCCGDPCCSNR